MSRKQEILSPVDNLIRVHDAWESDPTQPDVPTEEFETAAEEAIAACDFGDVPSDCRELVLAVGKFGIEWTRYKDGHWDRRGRPIGTFWGAFRGILHAREGAVAAKPKRPEPVSELVKQHVTLKQIAHNIYGHHGKGPFIDEAGQILVDKIYEESKKPGSVIPKDWIHPAEEERIRKLQSDLEGRMQRVADRENAEDDTIDPASIEELLRQGAFPKQIAKVKNVDVEEVYAFAAELGIKTEEAPNLASMRAPSEPQLTDEQDRALQPRQEPTSDVDEEESESMSDDELNARIVELSEEGHGASEIARQLEGVTVQKAAAVVREHKKTVTAS